MMLRYYEFAGPLGIRYWSSYSRGVAETALDALNDGLEECRHYTLLDLGDGFGEAADKRGISLWSMDRAEMVCWEESIVTSVMLDGVQGHFQGSGRFQ